MCPGLVRGINHSPLERALRCSLRAELSTHPQQIVGGKDLAPIIHERLLQSPIRCCDGPAAGGLASRTLTALHGYASGPPGSTRRSRDAAQRFRDEPS